MKGARMLCLNIKDYKIKAMAKGQFFVAVV